MSHTQSRNQNSKIIQSFKKSQAFTTAQGSKPDLRTKSTQMCKVAIPDMKLKECKFKNVLPKLYI